MELKHGRGFPDVDPPKKECRTSGSTLIRWARRKLILDAIEDEALYDDAIDVLIDFG